MYQPVLLYTTEEHGCSLTTFYIRVEHHEPTLLMIKTCNNEVSYFYFLYDLILIAFFFFLQVFGAYCSSRWYERNLRDDKGNRQGKFKFYQT